MDNIYTAEDLVQDTLLNAGASGKDMQVKVSDEAGNIYNVLSIYTDDQETTLWLDVEMDEDDETEAKG
jgi:hypothetical protein